ncbi:cell surface protein SprA [Ferruginibacter yonginensis]|uniref:Cell surface protein SprA n=1 Tax=Ferruginibacter yonginensis TaxID=1310416 RepID=A0ABV8QTJ6_9BACT
MLLIRKLFFTLLVCATVPALLGMSTNNGNKEPLRTYKHSVRDTPPPTLPYPIKDSRGDAVSSTNRGTYYLPNPSNVKDSVVYNAINRTYSVYEKVGDKYYRTPTTYTFEEFWAIRNRQAEQAYFQRRANTTNLLNRGKLLKPKLKLTDNLFNRLFGNGKIDITPQGNVDITAGYQGQLIDNPTLPERARRSGGLDFNLNAQLNVNASIGDKLKFPINYNTLANFNLDNQLKLDYVGSDDDIVKRFEAGTVSFASKGTLIPGAQQLFGIKTQLQFGKLYVTTILANQKSQRQNVNLQGGSAAQTFEFKADEYEENRHFLLAQYFKDNYNSVMSTAPAINSQVQVLKLQVWVTNRNGTTTETRDVVGLMDLAERNPFLQPPTINVLNNQPIPTNQTNDLLIKIRNLPDARNPATIYSNLLSLGLSPVQDFEKTFARKLDSNSYTFNRQLGTLSLSSPLQTDEVLGVAFQYSFNGKIYQVGEFSEDVPPDSTTATQKVLFLKLLKATSQRVTLPIWRLMMKNVYSVGYGVLTPQDFKLDVLYEQPGLGAKRYLPYGDKNQGAPIISLINLDRLNSQNDPQPDGVFDFIENFTVNSQYSRVIFPVLEPFGRDIAPQIYNTVPTTAGDTLFYALYDSIKAVAQQYPNLNRFLLKGSAKTSGSSDISIGYNIPKGSVSVTAGGRVLQEGIDYDINYDLGTIKIINPAILNSGLPVQVNFENNASFGLQQRSYLGLRLDYLAKSTAKEQLSFGGTIVRLSERPFFTKVNIGEDPIRNAMYGLDINYKKDLPRLTKLLDKLPFYSTKAPSTVNAYAEAAMLKPGHAPQIGRGENGVVYIDDFEGSKSGIDLRFPAIAWGLASTPIGATPRNSNTLLFPEATLSNNLDYGKNRAKIAWYQIEPILQQFRANNNPITDANLLSDPRVRQVYQKEIFPQRTTGFGENILQTFDLAYYPRERGPYNFDNAIGSVNAQGNLLQPNKRWGGLQRNIDQTDFETANIEFIEAWIQDPFINNPTAAGGKLYFNLGNISEDVLKDGRRFYENGLPTPNAPAPIDTTVWGNVPRNPIQVTNAFSNNPDDRKFQDIGLDGMSDTAEVRKRQAYLNTIAANFGINSAAYQNALLDPSSDDYKHYRNASFTGTDGILARYKNYNSPEGNSPIDNGGQFTSAATLYPDAEDFNRDNTLNETEEYYQYIFDLKPSTAPEMQIGQNYIVDKKVVAVNLPNGTTRNETFYQIRIPINSYDKKIGNIQDFKSIRFIRMYMTDFADTAVVRFAQLQLARNIWRRYKFEIDTLGQSNPATPTAFNVGSVNIEENDTKLPFPYRTPKDIQRQQTLSNNGVNLLQNEQAMTIQFCDLRRNDSKGVFQTFANRDLRQYKKLSMYIHSEQARNATVSLRDKDLTAIVRIGTDFINNYYEIRIPLSQTPASAASLNANSDAYNDSLWLKRNSLDLDLTVLTKLKQSRNSSSTPLNQIFRRLQSNGQTYGVLGNPNLGEVKGILIAVENTKALPVACGEVWVNELRLSSLDEEGGYAALARVDFTLADLGTLSLSGNFHTRGFGTLEQRVNERYRDNFLQYDISTTLELGKLLPKKAGIQIPVFASYSQSVSTPEYDPLDLDIKLKDKLNAAPSAKKDSIRKTAIDFNSTTTVNFTNVRKIKTNDKKPKIYDISNVDISYSYIKTSSYNPLIEFNDVTRHRAGLGYNYNTQTKYITPFKNLLRKKKTRWLDLVKDFNFSLMPSQISFRADLQRQFGVIKPRSFGGDKYQTPETYDKYFIFQRDYVVRWNLTRSLTLDYVATNNSRVDEPAGRIDTKQKRDSLLNNLFKGGRNTLFNQTVSASYTLPISKIPLLDFVTANVKYQANYRWIGASRLAVNLGNFLENGQQKEGTVQMDFNKLYQKSKLLRQLDAPSNIEDRNKWRNRYTKVQDSVVTKSSKKVLRTRKILDKSALPYVNTPLKIFGKLLTSLKQVNATIGENGSTRLPGYTDSTRFFGQNFSSAAPGFDFILGKQIDSNWLNRKAGAGLITKDSNFNYLFQQNFDQSLTASAVFEPVRDLNITVNIKKTFSKNYSETFRFIDTTGGNNKQFLHLTPYSTGGFDVSYIAFKTLFGKFDPNRVSQTFKTFQDNRVVLSRRLGKQNPYTQQQANAGLQPDGYYYGYGKYAVDVLIPSFIAAYTSQDPEKVSLIKQTDGRTKSNPFRSILPKPNWNLTYNGLSRVKGLDKIFNSFSVSHGYNGSLSMNGFTSALLYQDVSRFGYPSFYDTVSKAYIPFFLVPNVSIQEQFSPLLGFDMQFTNQFQAKFEYAKSRTLSLSLYDYQLSEQRSTEFSIGAGYRKKGLKLLGGLTLPKFLGGGKKLENEINFRIDYRVRDNVTANSRLDQDNNFATGGSREITITPTVDYFLSNRVNLKFYFDQRKVKPYISSSAPTTNTRAGIQVRISLSQ